MMFAGAIADIGLAGEVFGEAIAREKLCDELAVTIPCEAKPLHIPMPGEAHRQDDDLLQNIHVEREGQHLSRNAKPAPA